MQHRLRLTYPLVFPGCHPIRSGSLRSIRPLLSLSCSVLSLSSVPWRPSEILSSSVPHPFTILGGGGKCGHGTTKKTRESRSGRRPKGGGRTCVVAEKNCACLSLSLPLSRERKVMGAKKPQKRTTREKRRRRRQLSATQDRPSEEKDGWICVPSSHARARPPSLYFLFLGPVPFAVPPSLTLSRTLPSSPTPLQRNEATTSGH